MDNLGHLQKKHLKKEKEKKSGVCLHFIIMCTVKTDWLHFFTEILIKQSHQGIRVDAF